MASHLFTPFKLRDVEFRNRIFVSPMCQYSAVDGVPNEWHHVHLGSRAVGGAGLIIVEASAVVPEGRISPGDLGLWDREQVDAFQPITSFIHAQGSVAGIQLAHAGRKASTSPPWAGGKPLQAGDGGWNVVGPSPIPFDSNHATPHELSVGELEELVSHFAESASRALVAGFKVIELHMAHGYLMHEFLSPIANHRTDEYGGSLENRMRFPLKVAKAVRESFPDPFPVMVRISATDWVEGGWNLEQSVIFCRELHRLGIDLIDCSSGGQVPHAQVPVGPGYQVPFAAAIKSEANIATGAVGMITDPGQAEAIIAGNKADAVILGRELLRDPYWPLHAAKELDGEITWPNQYLRAK